MPRPFRSVHARPRLAALIAVAACGAGALSLAGSAGARVAASTARASLPAFVSNGRDDAASAFDILAPGEYGSAPTTANSTDQGTLYDALTPLRGHVTAADLPRYYVSERLGVQGATTRVERPRAGIVILRDSHDIPHVYGKTRADVMFGAGYAEYEDRSLLMNEGRGPARAAVLDIPGVNAFGLVTSLRSFTASPQAEAFVSAQVRLLRDSGPKGRQVYTDFVNWVAGVNAFIQGNVPAAQRPAPYTMDDAISLFAFIGSIFGNGGGNSVASSELLASLQAKYGATQGTSIWRDLRESNDPEAPTTISRTFNYDQIPSGPTPGSLVVDPNSIELGGPSPAATTAAVAPPHVSSNALLVSAKRSATGHPLAVMGPQLGYYYPEIVMQIDLHGGGIDAEGVAPPTEPYVLIGRGKDFAWSLTSATSQNTDQFLSQLCNADGSPATRASTSYVYKGRCLPMTRFDAGVLGAGSGSPAENVSYLQTVYGPVNGTALVKGVPYAISNLRSTRGREPMSALALADLNDGHVRSPQTFLKAASEFETTFNWFYVDAKHIAYYSSGRLPVRAPRTDPDLPTVGNGQFDWRGFLTPAQHPHAIDPVSGLIVNWNNKPAPGWGAADNNYALGPIHRVQLFSGFKATGNTLAGVVSIMNRAATQDLRAVAVWPTVAKVLAGSPAPSPLAQQAANLVTAWVANGASRLDTTGNGQITDPGAAVLDTAWRALADAVLSPVLGSSILAKLEAVTPDDQAPGDVVDAAGDVHGNGGSSFESAWYGYVDKDLRSELGEPVSGPYSRQYCGGGNLAACRASLWAAVAAAATKLAASQGPNPANWHSSATAERIKFLPGLIPFTMAWTNRSTFQQAISFGAHG